MSLPTSSSRRLASQCLLCRCSSLLVRAPRLQRPFTSARILNAEDGQSNPILDEYRRNNPTVAGDQQQQRTLPEPGDIGVSSIFEDDRRATIQAHKADAAEAGVDGDIPAKKLIPRNPRNMAAVLDPKPDARLRWEAKKVTQMVKRGGRLSKAEFLQRTEREHLAKSHNMKTSVKKLGMLARQIAGKSIDDAIVQMRFSKKKVAIEVRKQLEAARDEAVVMRGMGLGQVKPAGADVDAEPTAEPAPFDIQLKDGKRHRITDPSKIYIDQAWVGRGPYGKLPDYRAKGRINIMRTPFTSISVVLKEEATRVREYREREAKRTRQRLGKVWVPLPDRPIPTRRQWYTW